MPFEELYAVLGWVVALSVTLIFPGSIFGTLKGLSPDFWSQKTQTLVGLTRDPPESQLPIVNTDNVD